MDSALPVQKLRAGADQQREVSAVNNTVKPETDISRTKPAPTHQIKKMLFPLPPISASLHEDDRLSPFNL